MLVSANLINTPLCQRNGKKIHLIRRLRTCDMELRLVIGQFTRSRLKGQRVYRGRWQTELVFKRLKSIIGLGHLPKARSCRAKKALIHGKLLFAAFLIEALISGGELLFPFGDS